MCTWLIKYLISESLQLHKKSHKKPRPSRKPLPPTPGFHPRLLGNSLTYFHWESPYPSCCRAIYNPGLSTPQPFALCYCQSAYRHPIIAETENETVSRIHPFAIFIHKRKRFTQREVPLLSLGVGLSSYTVYTGESERSIIVLQSSQAGRHPYLRIKCWVVLKKSECCDVLQKSL